MKIKTVYLAGPMRGIPRFNFPAFDEAAALLRARGFTVISPAEMDRIIDGAQGIDTENHADVHNPPLPFSHYMQRDLPEVCRCDAVAVLPGWEQSSGATLEVMVARRLGKPILDARTMQHVPDSADGGEVRITDAATGGQKGQKLERFDLIPAEPLEELARVYGRGAAKYDDDNWRKGYSWRLSFAAMMRHAWKFWRGESRDELGNHHLGCVAWHAFTLMWFERNRQDRDDRADKV